MKEVYSKELLEAQKELLKRREALGIDVSKMYDKIPENNYSASFLQEKIIQNQLYWAQKNLEIQRKIHYQENKKNRTFDISRETTTKNNNNFYGNPAGNIKNIDVSQQKNNNIFKISIYPEMALKARENKTVGAYKAWILSRAIDDHGSGMVPKKVLINKFKELGIPERSRRRYINQAIKLKLLLKEEWNNKYYFMTKLEKACLILGCYHLKAKTEVLLKDLFSKEGNQTIWASFLKLYQGKNISREKLHQITGVAPTTQRELEYSERTMIMHKPNYAKSKTSSKYLQSFREYKKHHAFEMITPKNKKGFIAWRLPDTREVPNIVAKLLPRGRTKKANKALNHSLLINRMQAKETKIKLFYNAKKTVNQAIKKYTRKTPDVLEEIYLKLDPAKGQLVNTWDVFPIVSNKLTFHEGLYLFGEA